MRNSMKGLCVKSKILGDTYYTYECGAITAIVNKADNYFNASYIDDLGESIYNKGQWIHNWLYTLSSTKNIMDRIAKANNCKQNKLLYAISSSKTNGGIYVHPDLILYLADRISPEFSEKLAAIRKLLLVEGTYNAYDKLPEYTDSDCCPGFKAKEDILPVMQKIYVLSSKLRACPMNIVYDSEDGKAESYGGKISDYIYEEDEVIIELTRCFNRLSFIKLYLNSTPSNLCKPYKEAQNKTASDPNFIIIEEPWPHTPFSNTLERIVNGIDNFSLTELENINKQSLQHVREQVQQTVEDQSVDDVTKNMDTLCLKASPPININSNYSIDVVESTGYVCFIRCDLYTKIINTHMISHSLRLFESLYGNKPKIVEIFASVCSDLLYIEITNLFKNNHIDDDWYLISDNAIANAKKEFDVMIQK